MKKIILLCLVLIVAVVPLSACSAAPSPMVLEADMLPFALSLEEFEQIEPYTVGSNQEWALWALAQLENSEEKIRLYNFFLRAHTYLLVYGNHDFMEEYVFVHNKWANSFNSPGFDRQARREITEMINDEAWNIDIRFPLDEPFRLSAEEVQKVRLYFKDANPQFFLNHAYLSSHRYCDIGITPYITVVAYWAFAHRRQDVYNRLKNMFDEFYQQMVSTIDIRSDYYVVRHVYNHVVNTLRYNWGNEWYKNSPAWHVNYTILGYISEKRLTQCKGYTAILMYKLNRLGIPTIDMGGTMILRDAYGEATGGILHAWNIVQLYGNWYFMDVTWEDPYSDEWRWFLQGTGENNDSHFLRYHGVAEDMIYPEVSLTDFHQ